MLTDGLHPHQCSRADYRLLRGGVVCSTHRHVGVGECSLRQRHGRRIPVVRHRGDNVLDRRARERGIVPRRWGGVGFKRPRREQVLTERKALRVDTIDAALDWVIAAGASGGGSGNTRESGQQQQYKQRPGI